MGRLCRREDKFCGQNKANNPKTDPEIPPDTCPLRYVSATPAELISFTLVFV